jgi:hypothetical protein
MHHRTRMGLTRSVPGALGITSSVGSLTRVGLAVSSCVCVHD